uniref:RAD50-interacting protein 1 n=1 Tax=Syphacia muris TaxID=451379 RepID=A0A0N5AKG1_9BILA
MREGDVKTTKFGDHDVQSACVKSDEGINDALETLERGDQDCSSANELKNLEKNLSALPSKDIQTYFAGLRGLVFDVKTKADACQERIFYLKQVLPFKMDQIRKIRTQISEEGQKAQEILLEYKQKQKAVLDTLKNEAPDLLSALNHYSDLTSKLQLLLFTRSFLQAKKELKVALGDRNIPAIHRALILLQTQPKFIMKLDDKNVFDQEYQNLVKETKEFVEAEITKQLNSLGYPFDDECDLHSLTAQIEALVNSFKCYLDVVGDEGVASRRLVPTCSVILPFLLDPLKYRFTFNFLKESKLNVDDKPEWFFTLLMSWITANLPFLEKLCHLLFSLEDEVNFLLEVTLNMILAFGNFIIGLGKQKMLDVLSRVSGDKMIFSHLIDEATLFEKDLRENQVVIANESVLDVLLDEPFLSNWIDLETKSSRNSVEMFLSSEGRWKQRYREIADTDPFRVPECTDQFILLLDSITERYRWISDPKLQAKFFSIQLLMLDEFHLRLVQISQHLSTPWEEPFMQTLNSFWYISCVMEEWAYADVFITVQMHNAGSRAKGAFTELAKMYKHVWHQRVTDMCAAFGEQIQSQLIKYRSVKWFAITITKPNDITPAFCPFFLEVRRLVGHVAGAISPNSAVQVLHMLNIEVAKVLTDLIADISFKYINFILKNNLKKVSCTFSNGLSYLVLNTNIKLLCNFLQVLQLIFFSCNGASQMLYDMNSCLLPLLNSIYSEATCTRFEALDEPLFRDVIVSLKLLSLPVAPATLLRNELKQSPEEMASSLLANYEASTLTRDQVLSLFKQRCDIQFDGSISVNL